MAMNQPNDSRQLVSIENQSGIIPAQSEWKLMRDMAASLVPTGFLPDSIKTPEQAVAIMLKGRELAVPPMYALSNIAIVKGKPTISAEMMLALIYRDHGKKAIRVKESTDDACTIEYRLEGWSDVSSYSFTMDQAKKAGLVKAGPWQQYPAAMLRARCISAVARMAFPECIAGMYVPGELGDEVTVSEDGEVISASARIVASDIDGEPLFDSLRDNPHMYSMEENMERDPIGTMQQINQTRGRSQTRQDRPQQPIPTEVVESPSAAQQQTLQSETPLRDTANKKVHAVAQGLFGDKGHDVLHIMAQLKWGYDSLTKCNADELDQLTEKLDSMKDDEKEQADWYRRWIAPRMPQEGDAS